MPNNSTNVAGLSVVLRPVDVYGRVPTIPAGWECTGFSIPKPDDQYIAIGGDIIRCGHTISSPAPKLIVRQIKPRRWIAEEVPLVAGRPQGGTFVNGVYITLTEEIK